MRLLILTPEYDGSGGGIMTFYRSLVPALQAQGVEVRVIEGSSSHAAQEKSLRLRNGASIETLEVSRLHRWHARLGQFSATPGLRRHLAAAWAMWEQAGFGEDADVVEACDWGMLFVPPALDAVRPLLVQCHGSVGQIAAFDPMAGEETQDVLTRLLERSVLAGVDAIQTYSCANAAFWQVESGRHVSMLRPAWVPAIEPTQQPSQRGLVIGRVQRWKGPQVLCAALDLLGNRAPQIDWVGRDTPWGTYERSTSSHLSAAFANVWGKQITHQAPRPATEVGRLQANALFNVVPSTWDVFNFTAVEAMASGRPAIISSGAGAHELIQDGQNGYVFPSGSAEGLASAIERVLSASPSQLADIGNAARATISRALDPQTIAAQRIAAYQSAIDGFAQRERPVDNTLTEMCRPQERATPGEETGFLRQYPLRTLLRHVAGRLGKKALLARAGATNG